MNSPDDLNIPDDPHDAAAHWFTREHGGLMTARERQVFEAWRDADPRHVQAYEEMRRVWDIAQATPDAVFEKILQRVPAPAGGVPHRRRALALGLGAACTAALAAAVVGPERWLQSPAFSQRYTSRRGERRDVELPDGSILTLNTDSVAHVRFYESERRILLEQGEVFFSVATEKQRPFVVDADLATVKVTGTRFNVRRDPEQFAMAVESGSVEVSSGHWWHRDVRRLSAGQGAHVAPGAAALDVAPVNVAAVMAWRQGKAVFDAAPLEAIVAEMNRYRAQPILLRNPSLRRLRMAGVFSIDDPEAFLDILPTLAPVAVLRSASGRSEIVPR